MFGSLDNRQIESNSVGCLQSTTQMLSKSMWCSYKKDQDGEWKEVARTKKTKALVKGLKWMTTHEFQVVATNSTVTSISSGETSESIFPSSLVSAAGVGAGAATSLFLPYAIGASCEAFK